MVVPVKSSSVALQKVPRVETPQLDPLVDLEKPSLAAVVVLPPEKEKKKKSHKEGEKSSSKTIRHEGGTPRPLSGGILGLRLTLAKRPIFIQNWSNARRSRKFLKRT